MTGEQQSEVVFGVGVIPQSLDRINWGAFFFSWVWAAAYGAWGWFALLISYSLVSRQVLSVAAGSEDRVFTTTLSLVIALGTWGLPAIFATRSNRTVWQYQQERLEGVSHPAVGRPSSNVTEYLASQRAWAWTGAALTALSVALTVPWAAFGLSWRDIPLAQIHNLIGLVVILALVIRDRLWSAKLTSASS